MQDCPLSARSLEKSLVRCFQYRSRHAWSINRTQYAAGFWSTCSTRCVLHIYSPASVELFFCSSAFTSCLVCESAGLHLILVCMGMFAEASGGRLFENMSVCRKLFLEFFVFHCVVFVTFFLSHNLNRTPTQKMKKFVLVWKCIQILSTGNLSCFASFAQPVFLFFSFFLLKSLSGQLASLHDCIAQS